MSSEQLIPQKRLVNDEDQSKHQYQTRSTSNANPTDKSQKKPIINKFQPYISYRSIDFTEFQPSITNSNVFEHFQIIEDIPLSKRGFQYHACKPNPLLPILKFGTTDLPPYEPTINLFDRSISTVVKEDDFKLLTTDKGWVSTKGNVPIQEGSVYFEFNIIKSDDVSHVRIGLGRREASIEGPVGFDGYAYGLRDKTGQKLHLSRPTNFMKEGFKTGDVIGILVELPPLTEFQDIVRDQIAIRYKNRLFFERFDYTPTKNMEHLLNPVTVFGEKAIPDTNPWKPESLEGSKIKVYKNGEYVGIAFQDLYKFLPPHSELKNNKINKWNNNGTLGYYPMISVFKGGIAELNSGPNFKYAIKDLKEAPETTRGLYQVYVEKIADETIWDIIDEIEAESIQESIISNF